MHVLRAASPMIVVGVLVSALIVFASGAWFIRVEELSGTDKDWAGIGGSFAMGFFAFMVGALSTLVAAALARWFPVGLLGFAAVAIGLGVYVTVVALDQKPVLAPMFIVLHVVFVGAFGVLLPYRLYRSQAARQPRGALPA